MGKHAYLVMAHSDWNLLSKLLRCIDDFRNDIFIHVDKKASFTPSGTYKPVKSDCSYICRRRVSWGGYSMIAVELDLLEVAISHEYDYYHLISGQDLPIKSQDYIHDFFDNQDKEHSYIGFGPKEVYMQMAMDRLGQYHFFQEIIGRDFDKWNGFLYRLESKSLSIQRKFMVNRIANYPFEIYKGTNWFSLNHELAQYVVSRKKDIEKYFSHTLCADELFLQSVSQDSPFKDKIIQNSLREIDWERGKPYIYRKEDFSMLMKSDNLFARKFSTNVDSEIIDMICAQIGMA